MNELLTALVAAAEVGLATPECPRCRGKGRYTAICDGSQCKCDLCNGTGIDASNHYELAARAEVWLLAREHFPRLQSYPVSVRFEVHDASGAMTEFVESHEKTVHGRALAMARLVARVGVETP